MSHTPIVRRDPFRLPATWSDAPNVQFVWEGTLDEVDECRVGRPQLKVSVEPGRCGEDGPIPRSPVAIGHKRRVSGSGCVVYEPGAVVRPVELGHAFKVWPRLSAQRWHRPDTDTTAARAALLASPKRNQGAIGREA